MIKVDIGRKLYCGSQRGWKKEVDDDGDRGCRRVGCGGIFVSQVFSAASVQVSVGISMVRRAFVEEELCYWLLDLIKISRRGGDKKRS